jgi:hypothetical protein
MTKKKIIFVVNVVLLHIAPSVLFSSIFKIPMEQAVKLVLPFDLWLILFVALFFTEAYKRRIVLWGFTSLVANLLLNPIYVVFLMWFIGGFAP